MDEDKIRISWDDVQSTQVDARIKQQAAVARSAQQVQQFTGTAPLAMTSQSLAPRSSTSLLYNAVFYMALFGGIGGFFGWVGGEIVELLLPDPREELQRVILAEEAIMSLARKGEISEAEAQNRLAQLYEQHRSNPYLAIISRSLPEAERDRQLKERGKQDDSRQFLHQFLFFAMIAVPIAFWLSIGDQVMCRNWIGAMICGSVALALGLFGGGLVSLFINKIYQSLGGGSGGTSFGLQMVARAVGWGLLGAFMAIAPGVVLQNFKKLAIGLAGGLIGGLIGGLLFDPLTAISHNVMVGRFVAIIAIGILAGVGTGLIENAAKSGWLKVVTGLISGKQFVLYRNPTIIGSSPQCEIYLFKDPQVGPRHAAIHTFSNRFEIESLQPGSGTFVNGHPVARVVLRNGDQVQIGSTAFVFQEKERIQPA